jgi:hypothetical protein
LTDNILDMDLEDLDFNSHREEIKESEAASSTSQDRALLQVKEVVEDIEVDDSMHKFSIKNFELAKNFMKGRQCGRENTPVRSKETQKQVNKLAKISKPKYEDSKKAWDDDSQLQTPRGSLDKIEAFDTPKNKKITRSKIELKQFKHKVKVVRVQSVRRLKGSKSKKIDRIKKSPKRPRHHAMPPLPVIKTKNNPTFTIAKVSVVSELDKATKF